MKSSTAIQISEKSLQRTVDHSTFGPDRKQSEPNVFKRRKMLAIILGILLASYVIWRRQLQPAWQKEHEMLQGYRFTLGTFATTHAKPFDGPLLHTLDEALLPGGSSDPRGKRRLIFVGDIHGCRHELRALLAKVEFDHDTDHLIATGDVISKGKDSPGVLNELIRLRASSIRGNHEDRVLHQARNMLDENDELKEEVGGSEERASVEERKLVKQLTKEHIRYLRDLPLVLRVPALPLASRGRDALSHRRKSYIKTEILVVHAGLVPGVPLPKQDPFFVMNMRTMNRRTHVPSATRDDGDPWYEVWNWYQNRLPLHNPWMWLMTTFWYGEMGGSHLADERQASAHHDSPLRAQVVIYGHDSRAGLQNHRWTKGLDTGCVNGDRLTAMILNARGHTRYVSVDCKDYRS